MKFSIATVAASIVLSSALAFTPINLKSSASTRLFSTVEDETAVRGHGETFQKGPIIVDKPTGTSFLPEETLARCEKGNPTEKAKLKKDPINAWVDVYEYARKIREGEMTWEEVEKADLDTVSNLSFDGFMVFNSFHVSHFIHLFSMKIAREIRWYVAPKQTDTRSILDAPKGAKWNRKLRPNEILRR